MPADKNDAAAAAEELVDYEEEPEVAEAEKGKVRLTRPDRVGSRFQTFHHVGRPTRATDLSPVVISR